jgi:putative ABC transport system permease protein
VTGLVLRSLRHRATAFGSTFLTVALGTVLMGSFATLVETSTGPVSAADRETLTVMGIIVGSWGTLIVLFSLASTLSIAVRQRDVEIALLRTVGTTPRQARRMIRAETFVVALVAAVVGATVAWFGGAALLSMIRDGGLVSPSVEYSGGPTSLSLTAVAVVLTSLVSATLAGRKATSGTATIALSEGQSGRRRMRWWRVAAGIVLIGYGIALAVVTVTVMAEHDDPYMAMATSGSNSILVGAGLAVLAPPLLRGFATAVRPVLARAGTSGHLAAFTASRRPHLLSGILAPVIVLTSATTGTLMLVGIDGRTLADSVPEADTVTLLNNVVVGMIALFAAIMVINSVAAAVAHRRPELATLRLLGATPEQVRGSVGSEAWVVAVLGVLLGSLASAATVVPFALARDEGIMPDGQLWLPIVVAAGAGALTLGAAASAVRRTGTAKPLAIG